MKDLSEQRSIRNFGSGRWIDYVSIVAFVVFAALALRYQAKLLNYMEWGDESETIVAAKMIASGKSLYSQVFNHHGPLTFFSGFLLEKFGSFGVPGHRIPIAILQIIAMFSVYFSPLLKSNFIRRIYVMMSASVMLLYLPDVFGHMYKYQVLAGLALVAVLSQYTLPSILQPSSLSKKNAVIGNALIAALPFLAVTYVPVTILVFLASLRKKMMTASLTAFLAGSVANVAILAGIGSIPGFFAYHIYMNSAVLPLYNGAQIGSQLILSAFLTATGDMPQFAYLLVVILAVAVMASREKGFPWRSVFVGLGLGSLLIRGIGFHSLPFYYSLLVLPLVFVCDEKFNSNQVRWVTLGFVAICLAKLSLLVPIDRDKIASRPIPTETEFSKIVKAFTDPDDKIIVYTFSNFEYIASERLPASGHFFYLPWQEKYNENPRFGISIDACKEIAAYRPKIMFISKWKVWDNFPWESYAGCVQRLLDEQYIQLPGRPYFIRKDLAKEVTGVDPDEPPRRMQSGAPLHHANKIKLLMAAKNRSNVKGLKRMGIMFGTHVRQNPGEAELNLSNAEGTAFQHKFLLPDLVDNKYQYFDVPVGHYVSGEIRSISGGGVSAWESHDDKGDVLTCITYEYADGSWGFTPGCPLF